MKIQNLAVIFVIIILPISLILTSYVQNQVKTLQMQISYDNKLTNATYDAVKAFQLNTSNSSTSDLANSKLRDIKASANTFFNSVATQFNMAGYNKDVLKDYVPALVYTMYDGYYIYSPFTNKIEPEDEGTTYINDEKLYDLKPYIHYSCRYVKGDIDVVITYTLDNYITVEGKINGENVNKSGYLIEPDNISTTTTNNVKYRSVNIAEQIPTENLCYFDDNDNLNQNELQYLKINGVKYYKEGNRYFTILNGEKIYDGQDETYDSNKYLGVAKKYYTDAKDFTIWVRNNLSTLTPKDAVNESGKQIYTLTTATNTDYEKLVSKLFNTDNSIFNSETGKSIEDPDSNFNQHRLSAIRYSIEKNLSIAISNYNRYTDVTTNFQMPELKEEDWEKLLNNVSVISFLQGLSIGGKIYNGYSIVTNTETEEYVGTDSIFVTSDDGTGQEYFRPTDETIKDKTENSIKFGYLNTDFEIKNVTSQSGSTAYYLEHNHQASYNSIITQNKVIDLKDYGNNIYKYITDIGTNGTASQQRVAEQYLTALGRERWSMYRTNNNNDILKDFLKN